MAYIGLILELERSYNEALPATERFPKGTVEILRVATYTEGVEAARRMVRDGVVALVTRAGYISHLRDAGLEVPVIDIPFSMGNITQTCMDAFREYGSVGVVGTTYVVEQAKALVSVLGAQLRFYDVNTPPDYHQAAIQARNDGVKVLVGGYDETKYADSVGLKKMIMASGRDEIGEALSEAMKIVARVQAEAKKNEELSTLFDIIGDALIMFDAGGKVVQINRKACRALGKRREAQLGRPLEAGQLKNSVSSVLRTGEDLPYDLHECKGEKYVCSIRTIVSDGHINGAVLKLQSVEYVQNVERSTRTKLAERGLTAKHSFESILGDSPQLQNAITMAKQYSTVDSTVLIFGASGTGKELFSQGIHNYSPRADGPFVAINCATIPASLLESELFGYAEGAFTGAKRSGKMGLFELAHNGTIFLDEIGELELPIQARLLRVIEEKQVMRIGDEKIVPVNVRIIAATNKDLKEMVTAGKFRNDLFFRLNVLNLRLPTVKERGGDVRMLLEHFIYSQSERIGKAPPKISDGAMELLLAYDWPGNVREIANVAERLVVTGTGRAIEAGEILTVLDQLPLAGAERAEPPARPGAGEQSLEDVRRALALCKGNKTAAAAMLNISRPTLYRILRDMEG